MALGPIGTLLMVYGYGHLLSVVGAKRTIVLTTLLSGFVVLACHSAIQAHSRLATGVLYVFREAYIVLLIEQVWSFINSTVNAGEGRKLNGPVCGIASLGAIAGGLLVQRYAVPLGSAALLLFGAATLIPTGLLAALAYHWGGEPQPASDEAHGRHGHLGARTLLQNRTLGLLALLIAATQIVSTVLDLQLSRFVEVSLPDVNERTRWFGGLYAYLNMGAALFQFVLTPFLLHYASPRRVQVGIPLVHLALCAVVMVWPSLAAAAAAYMAFKIADYSLFRATKELLYIPLSFDARYRAKELIDAFTYRLAKGGASSALAGASQFFGKLAMLTYPVVAIAALLAWLPLAVSLTGTRAGRDEDRTPERD